MQLFHSGRESEILGINVVRSKGFLESFDAQLIIPELLELNADLVRLKVNGKDPELFNQLDASGIPWQTYTINYRNVKEIPETVPELPDGISVKLFDGRMQEEMDRVLKVIAGTRSWPEYRSSYLDYFIPAEKEEALFLDYFGGFDHAKKPNARAWFLQWNGETAGVFMGSVDQDTFNGTLYGILPEFRGKGLSKVIYMLMDHLCRKEGLDYFANDIHVLNIPSQRSAVSQQVVPREIFVNVILFPCLGIANTGSSIAEVDLPPDLRGLQSQLSGSRIVSWDQCIGGGGAGRMTKVMETEAEGLAVILSGSGKETQHLSYLKYKKP